MMRPDYRHQFQQIALFTLGVVVANGSFAAKWSANAGAAVGTIYSDNICLSNQDIESKGVVTVTPDMRLKGDGSRANMDLLVDLEFNSLAESSLDCGRASALQGNRNTLAPRLRFGGDAILVQDWFYFSANAFVDQNEVNPFGVGGGDNLNGRGNINNTYSYSVSPYISRRLSDTASLLLRYTYDEQFNSDIVGDSSRDSVVLDVGTSPELTRISVGLNGNYSKVSYQERLGVQDSFNSELSSLAIRTSYRINSQWQINGRVGEERNDFISVFPDIEGSFWDVGLLWVPNERVSVDVGTGERFFGSTPRFAISYQHKRSTLRASYKKDLTYDRDLRGRDQFAVDVDEFVEQAEPQAGDPLPTAGAPTTISNSPILNERFLLAYSLRGNRSAVRVTASYSEQTRAEDGHDAIFTDIRFSYTRDIARKLSFRTRLSWSDRDAAESRSAVVRDSDTWRFNMGVDRKLGFNTKVRLSYQYSQRNSEFLSDNYEENRLTLSFRYQL